MMRAEENSQMESLVRWFPVWNMQFNVKQKLKLILQSVAVKVKFYFLAAQSAPHK